MAGHMAPAISIDAAKAEHGRDKSLNKDQQRLALLNINTELRKNQLTFLFAPQCFLAIINQPVLDRFRLDNGLHRS